MPEEDHESVRLTDLQTLQKQLDKIDAKLGILPAIAQDVAVMRKDVDRHAETAERLTVRMDLLKTEVDEKVESISILNDDRFGKLHARTDTINRWIWGVSGMGTLIGLGIGYLITALGAFSSDYLALRDRNNEMLINMQRDRQEAAKSQDVAASINKLAEAIKHAKSAKSNSDSGQD